MLGKKKDDHDHNHDHKPDHPARQTPPNAIAFILDNTVQDIIHVDDRLAAILLSEPIILSVNDRTTGEEDPIKIGTIYSPENDTFTKAFPSPDIDPDQVIPEQ